MQGRAGGAESGSAFSRSYELESRPGSERRGKQTGTLTTAGLAALRLSGGFGVVVTVSGLRDGDFAGGHVRSMAAVMRVYEFAEDQSGHQQDRHRPAFEDSASHGVQGSRRQGRTQR
jgi:hypothetical protein